MAFIINGQVLKEKDDYLSKGDRSRLNSTMRTDLYRDYSLLMKYHVREHMSVGFDVLIEMLQDNPKMLEEFIDRCKKY